MSIEAMRQALEALESQHNWMVANGGKFAIQSLNAMNTLRQAIEHAAPPRIKFPTALRKMWSGAEVQQWLDEHVNGGNNA